MRSPFLRGSSYQSATFAYLDEGPLTAGNKHTPDDQHAHVNHKDWIGVFRASTPTFKQHALSDDAVPGDVRQAAAEQFEREFLSALAVLDADPHACVPGHEAQPLNCVSLCRIREKCLRDAGFVDIFKKVKDDENDKALSHLSSVLQELDGQSDAASRWSLALRGVFAGNIFDLGAATSAALFADGNGACAATFSDTRDKLVARSAWSFDHMDAMLERVCSAAPPSAGRRAQYEKVLMFVDNAGSDVLLGMLPLAREFIKSGSQVVLAANESPSCNDITAAELKPLLTSAAQLDDTLWEAVSSGQLRVVSSGNHLPVIDLSDVSEELVNECAGVDLVILEGMGRAIETNLHAQFTCDSWKLGMIKHLPVAQCLGGVLYGIVCKMDVGQQTE